jgi:hypothetical protein
MANITGQLNLNLTSAQLYWIYLFLLIGDLVAAFAVKVVPTSWGLAGLSPIAIAFLGTLADDYTETVTPNGIPYWVTYVVETAVMAIASTIGAFTGQTLLSEVAVLAWLILVLGAIATDAADLAGDNVPAYVDTIIQAVTGIGISFLTFLQDNVGASAGVILAALIGILASYFHVSATSSTRAARGMAARKARGVPV